ncbi:hypothetical protein HY449_02730 [Candidatus Pacearchaeota archaeon]|nr:hypothetical protein [Candidatus Pacearchaeota archaeon]
MLIAAGLTLANAAFVGTGRRQTEENELITAQTILGERIQNNSYVI